MDSCGGCAGLQATLLDVVLLKEAGEKTLASGEGGPHILLVKNVCTAWKSLALGAGPRTHGPDVLDQHSA